LFLKRRIFAINCGHQPEFCRHGPLDQHPARDAYGVRVAPLVFGYKELGPGGANITQTHHYRAEVFLAGFGWAPMDRADVTKVHRVCCGIAWPVKGLRQRPDIADRLKNICFQRGPECGGATSVFGEECDRSTQADRSDIAFS
jgi:hypothetical protein